MQATITQRNHSRKIPAEEGAKMKDVEIIYEPEIVKCGGCGKQHKASDLLKRVSTESEVLKLEEHAKNTCRINKAIRDLKERKISLYDVYKIQAEIVKFFDLHKIRSSNFEGEAEGQCDKCSTPLKVKIHARVTIKAEDFRPTLEQCRGFKIPDENVLIQLMRTGEVFVPAESDQGKELTQLMEDSNKFTGESKVEALKKLDERIKEIRTMSSISMDYLKSLVEPPPNVDNFITNTLEALEKTGLRSQFKSDIKECLTDLKTDVKQTHDAELGTFLTALQRLAQINAASEYP
jgi:hypothetical protein